jgi:hypothetical protein
MTGSKLLLVIAAASLAAGCTAAVDAQDERANAAPPSLPAPGAGGAPALAAAPAPQAPADDAMRNLVEEVARLRAQLADLRTAQAAAQAQPASQPGPNAGPAVLVGPPVAGDAPAGGGDDATTDPPLVERVVPVYVDRDVPVYVDRDVVVESAPTVVLERVACGDDCCDQWVPVGHVHSPGCGHHYYGCGCHPSRDSLSPAVSLSFTYLASDHDDDHHHDERAADRHQGHAIAAPSDSGFTDAPTVSIGAHRSDSGAARTPRAPRTGLATPQAPATDTVVVVPAAATPQRRGHQPDGDAFHNASTRDDGSSAGTAVAAEAGRTSRPERSDPPRRAETRDRTPERRHEPESRQERAPEPPAPVAAPAPPPPPPPPPPQRQQPQKPHKG